MFLRQESRDSPKMFRCTETQTVEQMKAEVNLIITECRVGTKGSLCCEDMKNYYVCYVCYRIRDSSMMKFHDNSCGLNSIPGITSCPTRRFYNFSIPLMWSDGFSVLVPHMMFGHIGCCDYPFRDTSSLSVTKSLLV